MTKPNIKTAIARPLPKVAQRPVQAPETAKSEKAQEVDPALQATEAPKANPDAAPEAEKAHNVRARGPIKMSMAVYGRGGIYRLEVDGVDAMTTARVRMKDLPHGVTIMGVESGDGFIKIRWTANDVINVLLHGEVVL